MLVLTLSLFLACDRDEPVPFPSGLEPLEDNLAPAPEGEEPYPEAVGTASGEAESDEDGEYLWAHALGYVHGEVADTWAALRVVDVDVDRRRVTSWTSDPLDAGDADYAYVIHNHVEDLIDLDYDIEWRHGAWEGTAEAPESAAVRWARTDGSDFLQLLRGSALVEPVSEDQLDAAGQAGPVTRVAYAQHLIAALQTSEDVAQYLTDLHGDVVATVHGEDLPTYD